MLILTVVLVNTLMYCSTLHRLVELAKQDARLLSAFGLSPQQLQAELVRHQESNRALEVTADQKRKQDAIKWSEWLEQYRTRLLLEVQAPASSTTTSASSTTIADPSSSPPPSSSSSTTLQASPSMLSSAEQRAIADARIRLMNANNPRVVLRNYIAQIAIEAAEQGDFSKVNAVLKMLLNPYAEQSSEDAELFAQFTAKPPDWASEIRVTCSS
jgi:uncharacterized protein YdiU (UPF0061 family)